ncbi:MAG: hydroxymethylbilane synthase [Fibrobacteria bacterium]|nr:hydroxymethylbilane synthase [Fibrobacteria bacterium]
MKKLIIGTRGSLLAVTQTKWVAGVLQEHFPELEIEIKIIKTTGDIDQKTDLDKFKDLGVFVKELQIALLQGDIHCAVHSLKDVPEQEPEELCLASFPEREDARDVLISEGMSFRELPPKAKVGTGSPRRILQLSWIRPDLEYVLTRGNIDTRINKVKSGELQGLILAAAGLKRLGIFDESAHLFSLNEMVPAIGQGALAIECRRNDNPTIKIIRAVNSDLTEACVLLEREFMSAVGGGCKAPMACHVYPSGDALRMSAVLGEIKTLKGAKYEKTASPEDIEELAEEVVWNILEECKEKQIPIPKDLPDHALLQDENNSES